MTPQLPNPPEPRPPPGDHYDERFDKIETLVARNAALAAKAVIAAAQAAEAMGESVRENSLRAAEDIKSKIAHHDSVLVRLEQNVTDVNTSVRNLLESVLVLQRNSMRVLGAGALLCGVLIFVLSRALGL